MHQPAPERRKSGSDDAARRRLAMREGANSASSIGMVLALVALIALGAFMLWPREGQLTQASNVKPPVATETPKSTTQHPAEQSSAPASSSPAK
jgi:hypothetical protein